MTVHLTADEARKLGALPKKARCPVPKFNRQSFRNACRFYGIDFTPQFEFRFHSKRKWRFDIAFPGNRLAIEIQGGLFIKEGGRHNRGAALLKEHEKLNEAACAGFRVLYTVPKQLLSEGFMGTVKRALDWR